MKKRKEAGGKFNFKGQMLLGIAVTLVLAGCSKKQTTQVDERVAELPSQSLNADISKYAGQIRRAIQTEIVDPDAWAGKRCDLDITLNPDGTLKSVDSVSGDPGFCADVKSATEQAKLPAPLSAAVHERVKTATLLFRL